MIRRPARRAVALLAAAALVLAGCTATTTAQTTGTSDGAGVIGVALPSTDDLAWTRFGETLQADLRARGYGVDLQYAAGEARTQAAQVQNMVTKGEEAVVLVPLTAEAELSAEEAAIGGGIPLVRALRGVDDGGVTAGIDPAHVGRAQAATLIADLPAEATTRLAVLTGAASDPEAVARYDAALATLAPARESGAVTLVAGADIVDAAVANDPIEVEDAAEQRLRSLLTGDESETPTAVLALGDAVTRGVVTALTEPAPEATPTATPEPTPSATDGAATEPTPLPWVVGSGADVSVARAVRDGIVDATVFVDTRDLAARVADAVEAARAGETPAPDGQMADVEVVRQASVRVLLLDTGWLDAEDL